MLYFWHSIGNRLLTLLSNMFTDLNLTDMETCYKMFVRDVANRLDLQSRDFGIEPEITCKVARMRARVYEVPISYNGRTYEEGKKIGLKDAFKAVWMLIKYCALGGAGRTTSARSRCGGWRRWRRTTAGCTSASSTISATASSRSAPASAIRRASSSTSASASIASDIEPHYVRELTGRFARTRRTCASRRIASR